MSTFHPAASSLANFNDTISTISTTRLFIYCQLFSSRQEPTFVIAPQLTLFGDSTVHTKSTRRHYIREFMSWFLGVVNFCLHALLIKCILGIKCIFPCSFGNKCIRLLTRVQGTLLSLVPRLLHHFFFPFFFLQGRSLVTKLTLLVY